MHWFRCIKNIDLKAKKHKKRLRIARGLAIFLKNKVFRALCLSGNVFSSSYIKVTYLLSLDAKF